MFCISVNEWHRRAVSFTAHIHTEARACVFQQSAVSLNEEINTWTTSPELLGESLHEHLTSFIWVKRSSYHIYIGYRNLKGPHGNLSNISFGLAEYITVCSRIRNTTTTIITTFVENNHTYAKYVYFKFYKMFTECFWVIPALMLLLILLFI